MVIHMVGTTLFLLFPLLFNINGQGYQLPEKTDLCSTRPNVHPNGEYLESPGDSLFVYVNWTIPDRRVPYHCLMFFSTCSSCRLKVDVPESFHYPPCSVPPVTYEGWCVPGCTYLHFYDKYYNNQTSQTFTSSSSTQNGNIKVLDFSSETSYIYVIACSNNSAERTVYMQLKITSEKKVYEYRGTSGSKQGTFSSPFFPQPYVLNSEEFTFTFQAQTQQEFITISFDDWLLHPRSKISFDAANIKGDITGETLRPWIISDKNRLEMTFETGALSTVGSYRGFKATYYFHSQEDRSTMPVQNTNCGPDPVRFNTEAGTITFNPASNGDKFYDCVWIIKKFSTFQNIGVRIVNYSIRELSSTRNDNNRLVIREGTTSDGSLQEQLGPSIMGDETDQRSYLEHISDEGFYIRLKGYYSGYRDLVLSYTSFNNMGNCKDLFICGNDRCIAKGLNCNGYDNCGDNSDENFCDQTTRYPQGSISPTSPISIGIIIPLVVSVFLIIVIVLLIIFIRRCRRLSHQSRRSNPDSRRLHINTVTGEVSRHGHRRNIRSTEQANLVGEWIPRDPPPSYEDVLNTTPIGLLNLGYMDSGLNHPIQPPSYEEAMSPTPNTIDRAFSFTGNQPNELDSSADSSLPTTATDTSHLSSSTTNSSDTSEHRSNRRPRRHSHRHNCSDSSDSSDEGGTSVRRVERREGDRGSRGEGERGVGRHNTGEGRANNRHSIAKPEDSMIEAPVPSAAELVLKNSHSQAPKHQERNSVNTAISNSCEDVPRVGTSSDAVDSHQQSTSTSCIVEDAPVITAASLSQNASSTSRHPHGCSRDPEGRQQGDDTGLSSSSGRKDYASPERTEDPKQNSSPSRQGRPNPGRGRNVRHNSPPARVGNERPERTNHSRNVPAWIQKAKNASAQHGASSQKPLMKHLSRSVGDLRQDDVRAGHGSHPAVGQLLTRQFSKSVQNLLEEHSRQMWNGHHDDSAGFPHRAPYHHRSQPLLTDLDDADVWRYREHGNVQNNPWANERRQLSGYQYDSNAELAPLPKEMGDANTKVPRQNKGRYTSNPGYERDERSKLRDDRSDAVSNYPQSPNRYDYPRSGSMVDNMQSSPPPSSLSLDRGRPDTQERGQSRGRAPRDALSLDRNNQYPNQGKNTNRPHLNQDKHQSWQERHPEVIARDINTNRTSHPEELGMQNTTSGHGHNRNRHRPEPPSHKSEPSPHRPEARSSRPAAHPMRPLSHTGEPFGSAEQTLLSASERLFPRTNKPARPDKPFPERPPASNSRPTAAEESSRQPSRPPTSANKPAIARKPAIGAERPAVSSDRSAARPQVRSQRPPVSSERNQSVDRSYASKGLNDPNTASAPTMPRTAEHGNSVQQNSVPFRNPVRHGNPSSPPNQKADLPNTELRGSNVPSQSAILSGQELESQSPVSRDTSSARNSDPARVFGTSETDRRRSLPRDSVMSESSNCVAVSDTSSGSAALHTSPSHDLNPLLCLRLDGQLEDEDIYV